MTEKEFCERMQKEADESLIKWIGAPYFDRMIALAKEAGAKFEPEKVERITWAMAGGGRMGFHVYPGGRSLTPCEASEVCRRYGDRAEVVALLTEATTMLEAVKWSPSTEVRTRILLWLAQEPKP